MVYNGTAYGYVHNLQGDIIAIVDSAGTKVVEYKYDAWGKPLSKTGSMASTLGKWNPFRYRGYVYDEETGIYYLCQRFYFPQITRFASPDNHKSVCLKSAYVYCSNNPINLFDPSGLDEETFNSIQNRQNISQKYLDFLKAVYDYSIQMYEQSELISSNPSVYTTTKVMENCAKFAKKKYSYERYDCAYSVAKQLPHGTTATGMTKMWNRDAIATISLDDAGGFVNLLQGMIMVCYDATRENPAHHGGIFHDQTTIYESTPSINGFRRNISTMQDWNMVMWVDGMILSPIQMRIVESILFTVRDEE